MTKLKEVTLAVIVLSALMSANATVDKNNKIKVEPSLGHFGYLPFNKWLFSDSVYAHYTTCDNYQLSQYNAKRTCELTLVSIDNKGATSNSTCQVQFDVNERAPEKFLPFVHGDKVILPHVYFTRRNERNFPTEMYLKYRIVDMSSCKSHDLKLLVNPEFVVRNNLLYFQNNIAYVDDNIDLFVPNDGLCFGAMCKLSFDSTGKKVAGPTSYLAADMTGSFVKFFATSRPNSYFALVLEWKKGRGPNGMKRYSESMQLMHTSESKSIELMKFHYKAGFTELFADVSNGLFGVCRLYSMRNATRRRAIYCTQFDENRQMKMDTAFNLGNSTRPIAVYNIASGGLLLISGKCGHKPDENLCQNVIFEQIKVNGKGKVRHIHECEYNVPLAAFAKDGDDGQICVSMYNNCDNARFQVFLMKRCYAKKLFY